MKPYNQDVSSLLSELHSNADTGLSSSNASQTLQSVGPNQLTAKKPKSMLARFIDQFKDPMILVLLAAAAINFAIIIINQDFHEIFEPILILLIVIINAIMGVSQESKAEKALDALKEMSAPHARVLRDGKEIVVESVNIVPGDIVLIEAGDMIPADGRLLDSASLKCEESALTGESLPTEKDFTTVPADDAPLGDRSNMVYSGCSVAYGRGRYVVTATGMQTEMGRIAGLLNEEKDGLTPLQQKLAKLSKWLGIAVLAICAFIFVLGFFGFFGEMTMLQVFMIAVSLAVSAIPEGLPAIVTIVLSVGVQRMVKKHAIIRNLPAVETLGSASVICSDKTGTLTQNRMTLVKAYDDASDETEDISGENNEAIRKLLMYGTLCTDGSIEVNGEDVKHLGDPTETSIILAAYDNGMPKEELTKQYPRMAEVPFDSDRKLMSVICDIDGKKVVITKGAFDSLASRCIAGDLRRGSKLNDEMSSNALRVLAIGYKVINEVPAKPTSDNVEFDLTFMGLVGMIDPPRPEVRDAVEVCRTAGIKTVMITGDHVVTASAIAKDLGILHEGDLAITGAELSEMSDKDLDDKVDDISVYARVSPEDKIRIVKAWQSRDQVVAMTGDGVNDAPALKAADIGCAMGITGTDVAKGAADMTLTDDNFTTIVDAVKEGRGIYDNIRKVIGYLLGTNIGEVLTVLFAILVWKHTPLLSMQLLWINLVTDGLPAIALGREPVEKDIMTKKPRPKNEGIFAGGMGIQMIAQGIMFAVLTLCAFGLGAFWNFGNLYADAARDGLMVNWEAGETMAFLVLALTQVFHSFNMRSSHSLFKIGPFTNPSLNIAAALSIVLTLLVAFIPPIATIFGLSALSPAMYLIAFGLAFVPIPVLEITKALGFHKKMN